MNSEELRAVLAGAAPEDLQVVVTVATLRELVGRTDTGPAEAEELLTPEQAAERLGVSVDWLYRRTQILPFAKKLSRKVVRYSPSGIAEYLANQDRPKAG